MHRRNEVRVGGERRRPISETLDSGQMKEVLTMSKLLVIAVNVDDGSIEEPKTADDTTECYTRVVGILDHADFDKCIANLLSEKKAEPVRRIDPKELYGNGLPAHTGVILHTHNSPGCASVTVNGWPFCYP